METHPVLVNSDMENVHLEVKILLKLIQRLYNNSCKNFAGFSEEIEKLIPKLK